MTQPKRIRSRSVLKRTPSMKHLLTDAFLLTLALYLSLYLRLSMTNLHLHLQALHLAVLPFVAVRLLMMYSLGVYQAMWRYTSLFDATTLVKAIVLSEVLFLAMSYIGQEWIFLPRTFFFIDAVCAASLLMGARLFRRYLFESASGREKKPSPSSRGVLIFGAGSTGRALAQQIQQDGLARLRLLGFVDDDPQKQDRVINGVPVLGRREDLDELIKQTGADEIIVAVTDLPGEVLREIVTLCRNHNIRPQTLTGVSRQVSRKGRQGLTREIELSDLLRRQRHDINLEGIQEMIRGKVVLVTGAGGSIGSELCRQIVSYQPAKLLLCDHSEFNLYQIDAELRLATDQADRVVPLLEDVTEELAMQRIFQKYQPQLVFHAAAYKHVHLVEINAFSSILNNVFGTLNLLRLCKEHQAERFVMISTDKAVNPGGVMGATKRVCELLTSSMAREHNLAFSSVRFGNVLGSSGSLIPLLQKQIQEGGPVTITDKDMTRYFMLIPEAVSLVLNAATIAKNGDVHVLKMGEPIRILELAKSLIALMGYQEDEISIIFTGLRPGEKLYEELYLNGNELETDHPDILTLPDGDLGVDGFQGGHEALMSEVTKMVEAARVADENALALLTQLIKRSGTLTPTLLPEQNYGHHFSHLRQVH